jgi:hypothetical protein
MFVLTVAARTSAPDSLRRHVLTWRADVGISATGWLGSTAGVSGDGTFIFMLRFESEEAWLITSGVPEYANWWQVCGHHLDTTPSFTPSTAVTGILAGGSDDAEAVRVVQGRATPSRLEASVRQLDTVPAAARAGVIGGLVAWHDDEQFTEALYFAAPAPGQLGLQAAASTPLGRFFQDHDAAIRGASVIDLVEPWLSSPSDATSGTRREQR